VLTLRVDAHLLCVLPPLPAGEQGLDSSRDQHCEHNGMRDRATALQNTLDQGIYEPCIARIERTGRSPEPPPSVRSVATNYG